MHRQLLAYPLILARLKGKEGCLRGHVLRACSAAEIDLEEDQGVQVDEDASSQSDLLLAVLVSCKTYRGPTLWHTEPRPDFPNGIPIVPITPLKTTFEFDGPEFNHLFDWHGALRVSHLV